MRNKIQKYLSGDHEGFSLVELIIVIAIMAILIGVVALAVLPYLEKSRESKDISMIDTVCSALSASVASTQVSGDGSFTWGAATTDWSSAQPASGTEATTVSADMVETVGGGNLKWNSSVMKKANASLWCVFKPSKNVIYAYAGDSSGKVLSFARTTTNAKLPTGATGVKANDDKYAVSSN